MTLLQRFKRRLGLAPPLPVPRPTRSYRDDLTDLSSRPVMHDTLAAALGSGVRGTAVLLDLDSFRYFNDRHGRCGGDELLRAVAARLRETLGMASCLARVGGDRFAGFLPGLALADAMRAAQDCVEAMREPVTLASGSEIVTLSAGVATLAGHVVDDVWRACDSALRAAKARGRDRVVAFDDDTRRRAMAPCDPAPAVAELPERHPALPLEARTDAPTGLRNRLALDELLHGAAADPRLRRAAIALISVDHAGDYSDAHGDATLRAVAHALKASARQADFVFRKDNEEFVVVLPDADGDAACVAAERMRAAVEALALQLPHAASAAHRVVTVTIDVASGPPGAALRQLLDAAAEKAMAARVGALRNRVHAVRLPELDEPA